MKTFILSSVALLTAAVSALPSANPFVDIAANERELNNLLASSELFARDGYGDDDGKNCLTGSRAQQVATNFKNLIVSYSESLANATLTTDFTDYSDSVNELINNGCTNGPVKLGSATFTSRAQFEAGQSGQPSIPFQQLGIYNTCHTVIIRWYSDQKPQRVTGIIILETVPAPPGSQYKDLIKKVYSEFNSGAWMVNLGICQTPQCK